MCRRLGYHREVYAQLLRLAFEQLLLRSGKTIGKDGFEPVSHIL